MARIISARVLRADGVRFEAEIANLTSASLFIATSQPLLFRERLEVEVFGVSVSGQVAIVIQEPCAGAVVAFVAPHPVALVLARHQDDVEVLGVASAQTDPVPGKIDQTTDPMPVVSVHEVVTNDSVDLETVEDMKLEDDTLHEGLRAVPVPRVSSVPTAVQAPAGRVESTPDLFGRPPLLSKAGQKKPAAAQGRTPSNLSKKPGPSAT